ncbi:unnamed protein product [Echinostoma caproni]|uniref:Uncharacterized protein n=1 Tax=Echinostoma caproni TaxID=27848 RepID=A0A183B691_9TREM|nr:unnamed protein product [Echinostoma caproni]
MHIEVLEAKKIRRQHANLDARLARATICPVKTKLNICHSIRREIEVDGSLDPLDAKCFGTCFATLVDNLPSVLPTYLLPQEELIEESGLSRLDSVSIYIIPGDQGQGQREGCLKIIYFVLPDYHLLL